MTAPQDNRDRLLRIMKKHELSAEAVGALLHVSGHCVGSWRRTPGTRGHNPTPAWSIELLDFKLGVRVAPAKRED
jgi:hypothetical protein